MSLAAPGPVLRWCFRAPVHLYRWRLGWVLGRRFLLVSHIGRRTGILRDTVLEVIQHRPESSEAVVIAGFGPDSDWYRNIQLRPAVQVVVGRHRFRPRQRIVGEEEAEDVMADYERRNRWIRPLIHTVISQLAGWRYDGTEASRRRLVRQLPIVAFRPEEA